MGQGCWEQIRGHLGEQLRTLVTERAGSRPARASNNENGQLWDAGEAAGGRPGRGSPVFVWVCWSGCNPDL